MPAGVSQGARAEAPSRSPSLRSRIPVRFLAASAVVAGLVAAGAAVPAEAATTYSAPLRTAVGALPVAAESNTGYDRDRYFGDRRDTDRDCQNTARRCCRPSPGAHRLPHRARLHGAVRQVGDHRGRPHALLGFGRADRPHRARARGVGLRGAERDPGAAGGPSTTPSATPAR